MSKRYYATVDANTGETNIYSGDWNTEVKSKIQGKPSLIYKGFNTEKAAEDFIVKAILKRMILIQTITKQLIRK